MVQKHVPSQISSARYYMTASSKCFREPNHLETQNLTISQKIVFWIHATYKKRSTPPTIHQKSATFFNSFSLPPETQPQKKSLSLSLSPTPPSPSCIQQCSISPFHGPKMPHTLFLIGEPHNISTAVASWEYHMRTHVFTMPTSQVYDKCVKLDTNPVPVVASKTYIPA